MATSAFAAPLRADLTAARSRLSNIIFEGVPVLLLPLLTAGFTLL